MVGSGPLSIKKGRDCREAALGEGDRGELDEVRQKVQSFIVITKYQGCNIHGKYN